MSAARPRGSTLGAFAGAMVVALAGIGASVGLTLTVNAGLKPGATTDAVVVAPPFRPASPPSATAFWDRPRRGANLFNRLETAERLHAAAAAGITFVRLAPNKWTGESRDFLIGDADRFTAVPAGDLRQVRARLDAAHAAGLKVVLTTLSLPGARWRQQNGNRSDGRLWRDPRYRVEAAAFWRALAEALRGHPALAGYNLLNEPHPELRGGPIDESHVDHEAHARQVAGTAADLNAFNLTLTRAIRTVDADTPIVVDCGLYATPHAMAGLAPIDDPHVLYSFHMYEPYVFTAHKQNAGRYAYPGPIPDGSGGAAGRSRHWDKAALEAYLAPVTAWQQRHRIPSSRVLVGELGCDRRVRGAERYLADLIAIIEARGWHWAFYSYREDTWDAMDYELGTGPTPRGFWDAVEAGRTPDVPRLDNPLWRVIQHGLRGSKP